MFGTVAVSRMVALQVGVVTMARSLSLLPTIAFSHRLANRFITRVWSSTVSSASSPEDAPLIDTKFTDSLSNSFSSSSSLAKRLDASRCGLEPAENTRHCPLVYHEQYSFEGWPENHTFPVSEDNYCCIHKKKIRTSIQSQINRQRISPILYSISTTTLPFWECCCCAIMLVRSPDG